MDSMSLVYGIVITAGAGIMIACIIHIGEVRSMVALALEPDRSWLLRRVKIHRALMIFFLTAYVAAALCCLTGFEKVTAAIVPAVFFLGAAFIYLGILMQNRMSAAMLHTLRGLIPICAWCKRIHATPSGQDGEPSWQSVETYIARRAPVDFSHGICPECMEWMKAGKARKK